MVERICMAEGTCTVEGTRTREEAPEAVGLPLAAPLSGAARLAALFDLHHRRLYRLGLRMLGSAEDAHDLVQETFLRAARALSRVPDGESAAEAWLVRVAVNVCRDRQRRRGVRQARAAELPQQLPAPDEEAPRLARWTVHAALAQLPARRRSILVMYELEGLSTLEISRLLGASPVTVRWHLAVGRRELARRLAGAGLPVEESP
jgi:RNA polymerase sigma factor (sigma-70 family)